MPQHKDIQATFAQYRTAFTGALIAYLSGSATKASTQTKLKAAILAFLLMAYRDGYKQSHGSADMSEEDSLWISVRMAAEVGFAASLLTSITLPEPGTSQAEIEALAATYAAGYLATLLAVYNEGLLRGDRHVMLTMTGQDGKESCKTCQRLKGTRHPARWWIDNRLIPGQPGNKSYECGGWICRHYLIDDNGQVYTRHEL
jgi:hypothetical protein